MEDEHIVVPAVDNQVENENTPEVPDVDAESGSQEGTPGKPPVDERTSAFRELRAHNKELAKALKEQGELIRSMNQRIPTPEEPSIEKLVKPTLAMFGGDVDAYEAAQEEFADAKANLKAQKDQKEARQKHQEASNRDNDMEVGFRQKLALAKSSLPDLDGALERIAKEDVGSGIHDAVVKGIKSSPVSAEIFHYLEGNRQQTAAIDKMTPRDQVQALKAIESWILRGGYRPVAKAAETMGEEESVIPGTKPEAPPVRIPPRPTGGSGVTHTPSLAKAQSPQDYLAAYRAEIKRKGG